MSQHETLLLEIHCEELPPNALRTMADFFAEQVLSTLVDKGLCLANSETNVWATPRRLGVSIVDVAHEQAASTLRRKGPSLKHALTDDGQPTKALQGFMRACAVDYAALERETVDGVAYFFANIAQPAQPLAQIVQTALTTIVKKMPVPKLMRWGEGRFQFARPVHGLVALHGGDCLALRLFDLDAGRVTCGHRFLGQARLTLDHAHDYLRTLTRQGCVMPSFAVRRQYIADALAEQARGQQLHLDEDPALLDEVTALVEWPAILLCTFPEEFLDLPSECLRLTLRQHQKYFLLYDAHHQATNKFLVVSNMAIDHPQKIIEGNERVVVPRLADARFFYDQDRKTALIDRLPALQQVVYHNKIGNQQQRVERLVALSTILAEAIGADAELVGQAARLAKCDLLTGMVGEFPELQGIMGGYYAQLEGQPAQVSQAIREQYAPRAAGAALPQAPESQALALADKLDALCAIFAIGQLPSGDKDPYGLRRAALGVVRIIAETPLPLNLDAMLNHAWQPFNANPDQRPALLAFIRDRARYYLMEQHDHATVTSALGALGGQLDTVFARINALAHCKQEAQFGQLVAMNKRVRNILKHKYNGEIPTLDDYATIRQTLAEDIERTLMDQLVDCRRRHDEAIQHGDFIQVWTNLTTLAPVVDQFFAQILVLCEDQALQHARCQLLAHLYRLSNDTADLAQLAE